MSLTEQIAGDSVAAGEQGTDSAEVALFNRGRSLVNAVAVAVATVTSLIIVAIAWNGVFAGHYLLAPLPLAWVFFVCYKLSQGRAWARWFIAVSLAIATVLALVGFISPPEAFASTARWYGLVAAGLFSVGLFVLAFSDSASCFFQKARQRS